MRIILTKLGNNQSAELEEIAKSAKNKEKKFIIKKDIPLRQPHFTLVNEKHVSKYKNRNLENQKNATLMSSQLNLRTEPSPKRSLNKPSLKSVNFAFPEISKKSNSNKAIIASNTLNNNSIENQKVSTNQVVSRKEVSIHLKKLAVNKYDNDKYNNDESKAKIITNNLPEEIANKNVASLKICEILKPETFKKLKDKFKKEEYVKANNFKVDEKHFRSVFEPSNLDKFNFQVSRDIERDNMNLIQYLHSKENVSHKLIEKLNNFDDNKLTKINRICQIFFHYENYEKKEKEKIKEKLKRYENTKRSEMKESVDKIGLDLRTVEDILKDYKTISKEAIKEIYRNKHNEFENKYWKHDIDKKHYAFNNCESKRNYNKMNNSISMKNDLTSKNSLNYV